MTETDLTLDKLPEHILEMIFSNIPKNKELRMVCHAFKNIIDRSSQLMKNKWLEVKKVINDDSNATHHQYYQNLVFNSLNIKESCWAVNYKHKERIKHIKLVCYGHKKTKLIHLSVLSYFKSLESFKFEPLGSRFLLVYPSKKFTSSQFPNLAFLHLKYYNTKKDNIVDIFSNVESIKKVIIENAEKINFQNEINWKLQQLIITNKYDEEEDEKFQQFLISQQASLKKLVLNDATGYADFIIRNLTKLENLSLFIDENDLMDDKSLISNPRLRRLNIFCWPIYNILPSNEYNHLQTILKLYINIQYLIIETAYCSNAINCELLNETTFIHLSHLMLKGKAMFPFLNANLPNLKVLVLAYDTTFDDHKLDFNRLSSKNLQNIIKLSLEVGKTKEVLAILTKCTRLAELNLDIWDLHFCSKQKFIRSINKFLSVGSNLACFGIDFHCLQMQSMTIEELNGQLVMPNESIRLEETGFLKTVVADDWGYENVKYVRFYEWE